MSKSIKNLFVFFGIFAACLILCLCALSACDDVVQTAEAYTSFVTLRSLDGIVQENKLPYYDFTSYQVVDSIANISTDGLFLLNDPTIAINGYVNFHSTNTGNATDFSFFAVRYTVPVQGYYDFTYTLSGSAVSGVVQCLLYKNGNEVGNFSFFNLDSSGAYLTNRVPVIRSSSYAQSSFNVGDVLVFYVHVSATSSYLSQYNISFQLLKLEYSSSSRDYRYSFSGFAIPGITYQENGGGGSNPSPFDDWDGFVNPNYLYNTSDFALDDLDGWDITNGTVTVDDNLLSVSTGVGENCTLINTSTKGFYYSQGMKITLSCYVNSLEGSATMSVTNATAHIVDSASTSAELNEGLNWVVFELPIGSEGNGIPYFMIFVDAETELTLEWVKLELGDLFTGYTEDDTYFSNWDGVVRQNATFNTSEFVDLEYWSAPALTTIGDYKIVTSRTPTNYLIYNGSNKVFSCFSGDYFTLSCYIDSSVGSPSYFNPVNPDGSTIDNLTIVNEEDDDQLHLGLNYITYYYSGSSTIYPNFGIEVGGTLTISWVKVETYPMFTGYFRNENEIKDVFLSNYINNTNGWTRQVLFTNFTSADYTDDFILSPTATVEYAFGDGVSFISSDNTATYTLSYHTVTTSPENRTLTMGIGYKQGTFSPGDISLSVKYQWYELVNGSYQLYDQTLLFTLQPYEVFVYTFEQIYDYPSISFTCKEGSDFTLQAIKLENGNDFTLFPDGTSASFEGYNNGFASGQTYGYDKGYKQATADLKKLYYDTGYQEGYGAGKTQGYSDGITDFGDGNSTWVSMLSAFIDVPIQAIRGFFDVEIFGFNFLNLFKMLVLISVLVYVIKFLVGKYA